MTMVNPVSEDALLENSHLADEMSLSLMLRGVGWRRNNLNRGLLRMQAMASAASTLIVGDDKDLADKSDRYMIARLFNTMGFTNRRISAMVQQFTCRYSDPLLQKKKIGFVRVLLTVAANSRFS
jgi:hypothetical protein